MRLRPGSGACGRHGGGWRGWRGRSCSNCGPENRVAARGGASRADKCVSLRWKSLGPVMKSPSAGNRRGASSGVKRGRVAMNRVVSSRAPDAGWAARLASLLGRRRVKNRIPNTESRSAGARRGTPPVGFRALVFGFRNPGLFRASGFGFASLRTRTSCKVLIGAPGAWAQRRLLHSARQASLQDQTSTAPTPAAVAATGTAAHLGRPCRCLGRGLIRLTRLALWATICRCSAAASIAHAGADSRNGPGSAGAARTLGTWDGAKSKSQNF